MRSRRRGVRSSEPSAASATATDTTPVIVRFTDSTSALYWSGGTTLPRAQVGQSGQPRPDPVRRTAPPVTTMAKRATTAAPVMRR